MKKLDKNQLKNITGGETWREEFYDNDGVLWVCLGDDTGQTCFQFLGGVGPGHIRITYANVAVVRP